MKVTSVFLAEGAALEGDVLRNVVVCGPQSKNGRTYTANALKKAARLYEGMGVYTDHDTKSKGRKLDERFGCLENVRYVESENKVRGDLRFLTSHPMAERVREVFEKGLSWWGLSHVADARGHQTKGKVMVEEVTKVHSVDLVDGAATATLTEQDTAAEEAPEDPFMGAVMGLLKDTSLDKDGFLTKVGELWDTLRGDGTAEGGGEATAETPPATEQAQPETLNDKITKLVEQEIAKALKKAAPKKYLKPAVTVTEQATPTNAVPNDRKALSAWLKKD